MSDEQVAPESAPALSPSDAAEVAAEASPEVKAPDAPAPEVKAPDAPAPEVEAPAAPAPEQGESAEVPDLTTKRRSAT